MLQLTWTKYHDAIFGSAYRLDGMPCPADVGIARRRGDTGYIAIAHINGRYMGHQAGTLAAAMKRLNAEIDRRSIGLFGVDDLHFVEN